MSCIQNELRLENLYEEELEKALEEKRTNFQEWLDKCPLEIKEYYDYTDTFEIKFSLDLAELVAEERALKRYNNEEDGYHTMMAEVTATE